MPSFVKQVAYGLDEVSADFEAVGQPHCHAFDGVAVVHDACVYQNVPEPLAEMPTPLFTLNCGHCLCQHSMIVSMQNSGFLTHKTSEPNRLLKAEMYFLEVFHEVDHFLLDLMRFFTL